MRRIWGWVFLAVFAWFAAHFLHTTYWKYSGGDPASFALFLGRQGWLYAHLFGGALTLVLGLAQLLWTRQRLPRPVHRWVGRVYVLGMVVGCVGAVGLIATSPAPASIRAAFAATMLAWVVTAGIAVAAILRRRVSVHRVWMIRNYLVTLAPVTFRLLLPAAMAIGIAPSPALIAGLLWVSWSLPLLVFEGILRVPGMRAIGLPSPHPTASGADAV